MLEDDAVNALADDDRATLARIHPPANLKALTLDDLPRELTWPFVEKDGSSGKLILVAGAGRFKSWNVEDRMELAEGVRSLGLPDYAVVGGQSFVIADIIDSMSDDGLLASIIAILGALAAVLLLLGPGRHGLVTIVSGIAGIVGMIALCDLFGLKVNFLDLVALPITIGIGIDYSVNLAARHRQEPCASFATVLGSTGGAVVLCSLTTIVGYGSLLLSDNAGIRSFGLAAILGEFACIAAALLLVPSLLAWLSRRSPKAASAPLGAPRV
jgi:predicted RND superfamily exporter protein